jgi:tetratricopeptide (TPR) repeat protein
MNSWKKSFLLVSISVTIYGCSKAEPVDDKTWKISFDDGAAALQAKDLAKAETSYRAALSSAQAFPKGDDRLAKTLDALGDVYTAENKSEDAKRVYASAYNEYKSLYNPHSNNLDNREYALLLATDTLHLANIARDGLRLDEAERLYDEALGLEQSALDSDPLKVQILEGKAKLFKTTGREADAEKIQTQLTELRASPSVDDTGGMSWSEVNSAGSEAFQSGNIAKAEKLYNAAVVRALKPMQRAGSMRGLGRVYDQRQEYSRAIAKFEEARKLLHNERSWELEDNLISSGWSYNHAKDFTSAQKMFIDAIKMLNLKDRHDQICANGAYQGLAKAYEEEGHYADAEKAAQHKADLTVELHGKSDGRYAEDLLAVTILQAKQKKNTEAAKGFLAVIALEESSQSPRIMLAALDSYAKFLRDTKQDVLADSIELKAKNLRAEFE